MYIFLSILHVIYLGSIMPFEYKKTNYIEIFNEMTILAVGYHLMLFTDFLNDLEL